MSKEVWRHSYRSALCGRVLLALVLAVAASGLTGCRTRSFLSTRQEVGLGKEGARQIEQEYRVDTSSADAERVRRIGEKLLPHIDKRDIPYSFKVLDIKEINAVSLPGGPVYIFRGLLDMVGDDDDALAGIIGHEVGHINARHIARQISTQSLWSILISFGIQDPTAFQAARLGAGLIGLKYSRDDEYEADRRGLSYAHYAGYAPEGMIRFFTKLERLEKRTGGGPQEWLRSHPLNNARIEKSLTLIENQNYRFGQ